MGFMNIKCSGNVLSREDVDNENGKSTKKYFDSKKAREMVLKLLKKILINT